MHRARMFDDVFAECVVRIVARSFRRFGRLEPHVVPAKIFKIAADLAEALGTHGGSGGAFAGKKTRRERSERLGFHFGGSLLADDAAAETTNWTRTGLSDAWRRSRRGKDRPAEIL